MKTGVRQDAAKQVNLALWMYSALVVLTTAFAWFLYESTGKKWYLRPIFFHDDRYRDLVNYYDKIAHLRDGAAALAGGYPVYNYEAPAAFVYRFLIFGLPGNYIYNFLFLLGAFAAVLAALAWVACGAGRRTAHGAAAAILTTFALGYPLWFEMDRANLEGAVWIVSAVGLCFLLRRRYWTAAALLGAGAAIKPFPVLFFLPLVWHKRFKETAFGAGVAAVLVVSALWVLGPNPLRAYKDMKPGLMLYVQTYVYSFAFPDEVRFHHSVLDSLKTAEIFLENGDLTPRDYYHWQATETGIKSGIFNKDRIDPLSRLYLPITLVGLGSIFLVFARMPLPNQVTAAGVAITLLPLVSADYTLLHLYVPFGCFVIFAAREVATGTVQFPRAALFTIAVIYALLFAPLSFLKLYAGDAKMLLLVALLVAMAWWPMRSRYFEDVPSGTHSANAAVSAVF